MQTISLIRRENVDTFMGLIFLGGSPCTTFFHGEVIEPFTKNKILDLSKLKAFQTQLFPCCLTNYQTTNFRLVQIECISNTIIPMLFNKLPDNKILDWSKLKAFRRQLFPCCLTNYQTTKF